jgi:hypothetical protein
MILEEKVIYRLVKVLYYLGFGVPLIFYFFGVCYDFFLPVIPDNVNSYIVCNNSGKRYSFKNAGVFFERFDKNLNEKSDTLLDFCLKKGGNVYKLTDLKKGEHVWKNWQENVIHKAYNPMDWFDYLGLYFVLGLFLVIYYYILALARELVLYVVYGKRISLSILM